MRAMFPDVPILGLTATSTAAVTKDVKEILRIPSAMVFMSGFDRWVSELLLVFYEIMKFGIYNYFRFHETQSTM